MLGKAVQQALGGKLREILQEVIQELATLFILRRAALLLHRHRGVADGGDVVGRRGPLLGRDGLGKPVQQLIVEILAGDIHHLDLGAQGRVTGRAGGDVRREHGVSNTLPARHGLALADQLLEQLVGGGVPAVVVEQLVRVDVAIQLGALHDLLDQGARQHLAVMVAGERTRTAGHRLVHLRQGFLADVFCPARFRSGPHDRPGQALGAAFVLRQGGPFADGLKQRHQLLGDPLGDVPDLEGIVTPRRGERGVHAIAFLHVGQHVTVGNRHHGSAPLHLPARRGRLAAGRLERLGVPLLGGDFVEQGAQDACHGGADQRRRILVADALPRRQGRQQRPLGFLVALCRGDQWRRETLGCLRRDDRLPVVDLPEDCLGGGARLCALAFERWHPGRQHAVVLRRQLAQRRRQGFATGQRREADRTGIDQRLSSIAKKRFLLGRRAPGLG